MRQELKKLMKEVDAAAARLNAGLGAVAVVLSVTFAVSFTLILLPLALLANDQYALLLGP